MDCIEVLRQLISCLSLHSADFQLVEHFVGVNWRVRCPTTAEKVGCIAAGLEQHVPHRIWSLTGEQILDSRFCPSDLISSPGRVVSISSRITLSEEERHLAMMNLHPDRDLALEDMVSIISDVTKGMPGYILASGRYYHFYGMDLLVKEQWLRFLAQFLMPAMLVSPRYIGHSLYRGYATLRLTVDDEHKPVLPSVCQLVNAQPTSNSLEVAAPISAHSHQRFRFGECPVEEYALETRADA